MVAINSFQVGQCTTFAGISNECYIGQVGCQCQCPVTLLVILLATEYTGYYARLGSNNVIDMVACSNDISTLCTATVI